jgi:hypothetical protein
VALRLKQKQTIWLTQSLLIISLVFVFGNSVTVPEGGVEKGQEFEVPYPTDMKADPTKPTPATVKVTAPSTLEAGFTFEAVADGETFTGEC